MKKVTQICIQGMLSLRELIVPGSLNKISWLHLKITPVWLRLWLMRTSIEKEIKQQKNIIQQHL